MRAQLPAERLCEARGTTQGRPLLKNVNGGGKTGHRAAQKSTTSGSGTDAGMGRAPWHARSPDSWRVPRRVGLKGQPGFLASGVGWGFSRAALGEPIAVAVHLEDGDVVGQPVEQRAGEALGAEGLGPFVERQVAGDQGGAALVALAISSNSSSAPVLESGTKPSSSMIRSLWPAICFCRRRSRRSSRASINS